MTYCSLRVNPAVKGPGTTTRRESEGVPINEKHVPRTKAIKPV
jgi:hypothetical protein